MAFTYQYTGTGSPSHVRRSPDEVEFPQDPSLGIYQEWQAWVSAGGQTQAADAVAVDWFIDPGLELLNKIAGDARRAAARRPVQEDLGNLLRFDEAIAYAADPSPVEADYPLLAAEVPGLGATLAKVQEAVIAEREALVLELAEIETTRRTAWAAIEDAESADEVREILEAIDWIGTLTLTPGIAELLVRPLTVTIA